MNKLASTTVMITALLLAGNAAAAQFPTTVTDGIGLTFNSGPNHAADFDAFEPAGGKFIRQDIYWRIIEPTPGQYNFAWYDWLGNLCASHGMHRTLTLCYGNSNYGDVSGPPPYDPSNPEPWNTWVTHFTNFAGAVASHYAGQDNIYEIWNEPAYTSIPDAGQYVALVKSAATAMKAADPTCKILAPSLNDLGDYTIDTRLQSYIDVGLLNYVDAISVHSYTTSNPETMVEGFAAVRSKIGSTMPIVVTEGGYSTGIGNVSVPNAQVQADYLVRMFLVNASQGVRFTTAFEWKDADPDPNNHDPNDYESNFGIVKSDGTPKPAYYAMQELTRSLRGTTFTDKLPSPIPSWQVWRHPENDWLLEFTSPNGEKTLAAWTTGDPRTLDVPGWGILDLTNTPQYINPVPEPQMLVLLSTGLIGLLAYAWRRWR